MTLPRPTVAIADGRTFRGIWPQNLPETGEGPYIRELVLRVRGVPEVTLPVGRADVMTNTHVYEVEPVASWRTGARQAFAYAGMTGLAPALALFGPADYLPIYLRIRDRMKPLELWIWTGAAGWEPASRRVASRRIGSTLTYRGIADDITARIRAGEPGFRPRAQLPTYAELADLYSVSVSTASRAVGLLHERDLVESIVGRATYVRQPA